MKLAQFVDEFKEFLKKKYNVNLTDRYVYTEYANFWAHEDTPDNPNSIITFEWVEFLKEKQTELFVQMEELLIECNDYLNTNNLTSIGHGSILHQKIKDLIK